jgi:hypothetical protein
MAVEILSVTGKHRFWDKVNKQGPVMREELGPCWVWTGAQHPSGYGLWHEDILTGVIYAHRHSYEMAHPDEAPLPRDIFVMHKCDNPPCVRPSHLGKGTNADNLRDMAEKGRARGGRRTKDGREPKNRR